MIWKRTPYAFNWEATTLCSEPGLCVQGDPLARVEPDLHTGAIVWKRQTNAGWLQI